MARAVLGFGTSHSPQLSTEPDLWPLHVERDRNNPALNFEELQRQRESWAVREVTPEKCRARYEACQRGIAALAETLARVGPDALVIIGDDQHEWFHDDNMPAVSIYWGEMVENFPPPIENRDPSLRPGYWAYYGDGVSRKFPVASALARHLIESLVSDGFDMAHSRRQREGVPFGHAWGFVHQRLMNGRYIPIVPVLVNTYYPPNQPTPRRCYELGRALRRAIEAWDRDERIGVVGSGGLSHFVIDEELDRRVLKGLLEKDPENLTTLPIEKLNSGNSEIRNWIAAAGALEHLEVRLIDYVPCYRSLAGTGCAMAFATWTES